MDWAWIVIIVILGVLALGWMFAGGRRTEYHHPPEREDNPPPPMFR